MSIIPLKGFFENPQAFLAHIAETPELVGFVIITKTSDGSYRQAHINCDRGDLAYAGASLLAWSQQPDIDA